MGEIVSAFGIDVRLLVIQAINFGLLLLVLWHFLYKPVLKMIEARRLKIEQGVKDAEASGLKLSEIESEKGSIMTEAMKEAEGIVGNAKRSAADREKEMLAEAELKSERVLAESREHAKEESRLILEESKSEIAKMAVLGAERILKEKND
ncbi:MAG: F0F1 ATP synthase subunit B [Parcubacteria group bacterium]|nr:F0F1 ATP synthase subunit B [Parcubacteria group bacterium]